MLPKEGLQISLLCLHIPHIFIPIFQYEVRLLALFLLYNLNKCLKNLTCKCQIWVRLVWVIYWFLGAGSCECVLGLPAGAQQRQWQHAPWVLVYGSSEKLVLANFRAACGKEVLKQALSLPPLLTLHSRKTRLGSETTLPCCSKTHFLYSQGKVNTSVPRLSLLSPSSLAQKENLFFLGQKILMSHH